MFKGSLVAIVTPMHEDGSLDLERFCALIDFHVEQETDGIVVVGTTGESPTVNFKEHNLLISTAVEHAAGRIPIIAGTGANSTTEAIDLSTYAKDAGADASLSVVPYYNKPTQEGLYQHYKSIAEAVDIPQIIYNVPGRTVADINNDTVLRLSKISNIIGIKDATGHMGRGFDLLCRAPEDFAVYSGDDASSLALLLQGGHGTISVTANIRPDLMHDVCKNMLNQKYEDAKKINKKLEPLHKAMFLESNPIPVKWLLGYLGKINSKIRLPLVTLDEKYHQKLITAYEASL